MKAHSSTPRTPADEISPELDSANRIADTFKAFVSERRQQKRKHASSLAYMEELLNKLPDDVADDLKFEFISKLQSEITKLKHQN